MGLSSFGSSSSQLGKTVLIGEPERALRVPPAADPDPDAVESVLSGGRELRRLDRRSFLMVGNEGAVPKRGGQLRSSRSIAIVDDEADGEGGADEGVWVNANEAREVGKGCLGDGTGERVGSVISRSLGVTGRRICLAMREECRCGHLPDRDKAELIFGPVTRARVAKQVEQPKGSF